MKNKKIFIIILFTILLILLLFISYILFFKDKNIENPNNNLENPIINNQGNLGLENNKNFINQGNNQEKENILEKGDPNEGLNIEVDGFKNCREEKCFKDLFLECNLGGYINFTNEKSIYYSFSILNKYKNNCILLIQDLKNNDSENINCSVPLSEMTENTLNKFLSLDQENINKYCN
jgi:hypothetical protein